MLVKGDVIVAHAVQYLPGGLVAQKGRITFDKSVQTLLREEIGGDTLNHGLFQCGIWPITMATTELKPGGYQRFRQIAEKLER